MSKLRVWVFVLYSALQALLVLAPFIPLVKSVYPANSAPRHGLEFTVSFIAAEFALSTIALALDSFAKGKEEESFRRDLTSRFEAGRVRAIRDDEFYRDFLHHVGSAERSVSITYLALYPPDDIQSKPWSDYYKKVARLMKDRKQVKFRRLVRESEKNEAWLAQLITELKGYPNVSIATLADSGQKDLPHAVSAQIVDGERAWLVALNQHVKADRFRDIFFEDRAAASTLQEYYDRLWDESSKLLVDGVISEHGSALLARAAPSGQERGE